MRILLLVATAVTLFLAAKPAEAAGRRFFKNRPPVYLTDQGAWGREFYPQYYGGIHARNMQNIGIPNGDIGIRGNGGVTPYPW
ncbi:MAG TPA: hypothetical protein VFB80_02800 [Pirellulaceae bacterium]|nr:hypothetical protein [Pirellulaceae bacterium]